MLNFLRVASATSLIVLGSGCTTVDAWQYKTSDLSGKPKGSLAVLLFLSSETGSTDDKASLAAKADPGVTAALDRSCKPKPSSDSKPLMAPILVPIAAAVAQLGFEAYMDKLSRDVAAIVDAAKEDYSATVLVPATGKQSLEQVTCLVVVRYTEDKGTIKPQLSAVLKLTDRGPALTNGRLVSIRPIYFRILSATAATRDTDTPTVSVSLAISVKAAAMDANAQVIRLAPAGETVTTVPKIVLRKEGTTLCDSVACNESDLLIYPVDRGTLSLTVAVAEQGVTGFDDKTATSEIAALKAAIGPALSDAVKAKYGSK